MNTRNKNRGNTRSPFSDDRAKQYAIANNLPIDGPDVKACYGISNNSLKIKFSDVHWIVYNINYEEEYNANQFFVEQYTDIIPFTERTDLSRRNRLRGGFIGVSDDGED